MKLPLILLVSILLTACASTPKNSQFEAADSKPQAITLPQDPHSQAIIKILTVMHIPEIIRVAMKKEFTQNPNEQVSAEYVQCIQEQLTDNQILSLMVPVYKNNIDQETAKQLVEFYTGPTGQKISTMLSIKLGEPLPMPQITKEDVANMQRYEPLLDLLNSEGIQNDAETAGFNLGIQLGVQCAATGSI